MRLNTCRVRTGGRRTGEGHGRGTHRLTRARARAGGRGAANEYVLTPRACHPSCRPASGGERHRTPPVRERLPSGCRRHRRLGLAHVERLPTSATNGSASGRRASQAEHSFSFCVDRWRSAVVGLYETVSAGADRLPDSPDPERWPWALGVRPLAAVPPPVAQRVPGQQGPQSGLPERVYDQVAIRRMYAAVAQSSPPPGPRTLEQRVHQLDRADVTRLLPPTSRALPCRSCSARWSSRSGW